MPASASVPRTTTQKLLGLPDEELERWLIDDELQKQPTAKRNKVHSAIMARLAKILGNWNDLRPEPRAEVVCGETRIRLQRNPDCTMSMDTAFVPRDVFVHEIDGSTLIEGVPTLAIEILTPTDHDEETNAKINTYLRHGVPLVWIMDPCDQTVRTYRPGEPPQLFTCKDELTGDPVLTGFRVSVSQMFP